MDRFPAIAMFAAELRAQAAAIRREAATANAVALRRADAIDARAGKLDIWNTKADAPPAGEDTTPGGEEPLPPVGTGALAGTVRLENAGALPLGQGIASFATVFAEGEVPAGSGIDGAQLDVRTRWPDGSAKHAQLAVRRPLLLPGEGVDIALRTGAAQPAGGLALAAALQSSGLTVDVTTADGRKLVLDGLALAYQLDEGDGDFWRRGPLVTEARFVGSLGDSSLRVLIDAAVYTDGTFAADVTFANDRAMEAVGGRLAYTARVTLAGQSRVETVDQAQYQAWRVRLSSSQASGGQGVGGLHIKHDVPRLIALGAVAHYDLTLRPPEAKLAAYASAMAAPGWGVPLADNGVQRDMPTSGGRPDIGVTSQPATDWLLSQDPRAAAYALGWAEAAGAVTWRYWDAAHGEWLNAGRRPTLWVQNRFDNPEPPTQPDDGESEWRPEAAHQPDLSFVPYLLTGERWMLDNLLAQAAWNTVYNWPGGERRNPRTGAYDLVVKDVQTRQAGWALRQLENAAWAAPDGGADKAYFAAAADAQWTYLLAEAADLTPKQGELAGWLPNLAWTGGISAFSHDYFASVVILMAARGSPQAHALLDWMRGFLVGRFEPKDGWNIRDGIAYSPRIGRPGPDGWVPNWDAFAKTWAEFGSLTRAAGASNGDGWERSQGNYGMWALATLAGIWHLDGDPRALAAYRRLAALNPPFTTEADFAREPSSPIRIAEGPP